ncbi:MAG: preprotein translocase subunit YajC [Erysipelotrichaceae bacterium]
MNWEVITWSCLTFAFLIIAMLIIYYLFSFRLVKKREIVLQSMHENLKTGARITFAGGIKGSVVSANGDELLVEIAKNTIITISRYAITSVDN